MELLDEKTFCVCFDCVSYVRRSVITVIKLTLIVRHGESVKWFSVFLILLSLGLYSNHTWFITLMKVCDHPLNILHALCVDELQVNFVYCLTLIHSKLFQIGLKWISINHQELRMDSSMWRSSSSSICYSFSKKQKVSPLNILKTYFTCATTNEIVIV